MQYCRPFLRSSIFRLKLTLTHQTRPIAAHSMAPKRKRINVGAIPEVLGGEEARLRSPFDISATSDIEKAYEPPGEGGGYNYFPGGKRGIANNTAAAPKRKKKTGPAEKKNKPEEDTPRIRPPVSDSDYVPVPFKGRLGYACLNTYLRTSFTPIFCSRTCRIETILKQGPWPSSGLAFVQSLGLQNARDLSKMIEWNEKYQIRFLRVSSEMFPFASHAKYGYDLDFAYPVLREAGKLAMKYGHRLTTHPGQFTQLGSPRPEVIEASVKDLEYHAQLLRGLGLEGQADRDAVMILHMGGMFGDKAATLNRFRENYTTLLSEDIKRRLVLENDDVIWSVHDLLPICQELNIPLVLDYHHHNIIHDASMREGTADIMELFPAIKATWTRKSITQKQHYSEPCEGAITGREMRKHSPRVAVLPPCDDTMDLMIEAKDKEQAVFELYRKYAIGGEDLFREVVPHERTDDNRPPKGKKEAPLVVTVPDEEVGMGGLERRVYWPLGNEDWLSPRKRVMKNKVQPENNVDNEEGKTSAAKKPRRKKVTKVKEEWVDEMEEVVIANATNTPQSKKTAVKMPESTISVTKQASASASPVISASFTKRRLSRRIAATAAAREAAVPLSPMSSGLSSPPSEET